MNKRDNSILDIAIVIVLVFAILSSVVWWLETRFDSTFALLGVGAFLGVGLWVASSWFEQRQTRSILSTAADYLHETANVYVKHATAQGQNAAMMRDTLKHGNKIENDLFNMAAKLADQRQRFLVDGKAQEVETPSWMNMQDDSDMDLSEFLTHD